MIKKLIIISTFATIVSTLIFSGVLEVQVHMDKLSSMPRTIMDGSFASSTIFSQSRAYVVDVKRKGKIFFAKDELRRLDLSLGYVEKDTESLQKSIAEGELPSTVISWADVLLNSVQGAREHAAEVSGSDLVAKRERSLHVMQQAAHALQELEDFQKKQEAEQKGLADITSSLREEIGQVQQFVPVSEETVAGDKDSVIESNVDESSVKEEYYSGEDKDTIPLKF